MPSGGRLRVPMRALILVAAALCSCGGSNGIARGVKEAVLGGVLASAGVGMGAGGIAYAVAQDGLAPTQEQDLGFAVGLGIVGALVIGTGVGLIVHGESEIDDGVSAQRSCERP